MLEEFAARQGFTNIVHFTDDGISAVSYTHLDVYKRQTLEDKMKRLMRDDVKADNF